ncbi:ABC transporter permease [Telmatobacter sp. DSM 110680]|uniref:ABC transporter permease n=1 Tax=Telmatobacter sp. DSM 110680 TaxID=3036704 RepID=A0AAU7DNA5_9BACT
MRWIEQLRMQIQMLLGRERAGTRLNDELAFHLDRQIAENIAAGMTPEEAGYSALRTFGNPALLRERTRTTWSWNGLESLLRDFRFAFRALRRTPGFTAIAIVVMALGIGANVALFTVVRNVILKPLPFKDPDRLLMLYEDSVHTPGKPDFNVVAGGVYQEWKKQNHTFSNLALVGNTHVNLSGSSGQLPEKLAGAQFSWDLLPTLGVEPALGRNFVESEDSPSANGTVLLSWRLWKRRFGGNPAILNQSIFIDAAPYMVIGVMPAWFDFPRPQTQLWLPVSHERPMKTMTTLSDHTFGVVGRLRPGISEAQAEADLSLISLHLHNANLSDPFVFKSANSRPLLEHMVGPIKPALYVLLAATTCVLLIACLNIANLLIARATARRKDLAIRSALGGGRLRLLTERLMESLLLSAFGGAFGILLAYAALQWLIQTRHDMSRVETIHFDGVVIAFTGGIIFFSALFSGVISAISTGDAAILSTLHESSRGLSGSRERTSLRRVLLTLQVGLTVVLLAGAGLLVKSYERLRSTDMGCSTQNVLTLRTGLPDARYKTPAERVNFFDTLLDRIRNVPGITAAGIVESVPGQGYWGDTSFTIVGHPPLPQGSGIWALNRSADPGYFQAMGIPILRGRTFNPALRLKLANEIIVDQTFVNKFMPGEEPIGKHVHTNDKDYVIVGVVGATRFQLGEDPNPIKYFSLGSGEAPVVAIVIRSNQDVAQFALPVQRIVSDMDRDLAVSDILTMDQLLGKSTLDSSFNAILLTALAVLSLILAAVGIFGVLSYIVAQRTGEIGIRIALGAQREQVLRLMLVNGMWPALIGLVVGLVAAAAATRLLRTLLFATQPLDPAVFASVAATLLAVAAIACLIPAWRASRLDPMQALRTE